MPAFAVTPAHASFMNRYMGKPKKSTAVVLKEKELRRRPAILMQLQVSVVQFPEQVSPDKQEEGRRDWH